MSTSTTKGVEDALRRNLSRDLPDVPSAEIAASLETRRGGVTRGPRTQDSELWQWWMIAPQYVRGRYAQGADVRDLVRETRLDEALGSYEAARRQAYRWLGLNGFRRHRPRTVSMSHDPAEGLPARVVRRQRPKPRN